MIYGDEPAVVDSDKFSEISLDGTSEAEIYQPPKEYSPLQSLGSEYREETTFNPLAQGSTLKASLSQLPGVASSVFSSFSNILKGTANSPQSNNEHQFASPAFDDSFVPEQPLPTFENLYIGQAAASAVPDIPISAPTFYSPTEAPLLGGPTVPPPNPISGNTFRLKDRKKTYAPVPGLNAGAPIRPTTPSGIQFAQTYPTAASPSAQALNVSAEPPKPSSSFSLTSLFPNPLPLLDKLQGPGDTETKPIQYNSSQTGHVYSPPLEQHNPHQSVLSPVNFFTPTNQHNPVQPVTSPNNFFVAPSIDPEPVIQSSGFESFIPSAPSLTPSASPGLQQIAQPAPPPFQTVLASTSTTFIPTPNQIAEANLVYNQQQTFSSPFDAPLNQQPPAVQSSLPAFSSGAVNPPSGPPSALFTAPLQPTAQTPYSSPAAPPLAVPPVATGSTNYRLKGRPLHRKPIATVAAVDAFNSLPQPNYFNPYQTASQPSQQLPPSTIESAPVVFNPYAVPPSAEIQPTSFFNPVAPISPSDIKSASSIPTVSNLFNTPPTTQLPSELLAQAQSIPEALSVPQQLPIEASYDPNLHAEHQPDHITPVDSIDKPLISTEEIGSFLGEQASIQATQTAESAQLSQNVVELPQNTINTVQPETVATNQNWIIAPPAPIADNSNSFATSTLDPNNFNTFGEPAYNSPPTVSQFYSLPTESNPLPAPPKTTNIDNNSFNPFRRSSQQASIVATVPELSKPVLPTNIVSPSVDETNPSSDPVYQASVTGFSSFFGQTPTQVFEPIDLVNQASSTSSGISSFFDRQPAVQGVESTETVNQAASTDVPSFFESSSTPVLEISETVNQPPPTGIPTFFDHSPVQELELIKTVNQASSTASAIPSSFEHSPPVQVVESTETTDQASSTGIPSFFESASTPVLGVTAPVHQPPSTGIASFFTPSSVQPFDSAAANTPLEFNSFATQASDNTNDSNNPQWFSQLGSTNDDNNKNQIAKDKINDAPSQIPTTSSSFFDVNENTDRSNDIQLQNFFNNPPPLTDTQHQDPNFNIIGKDLVNKRLATVATVANTSIDPSEALSASSNIVEPASSVQSEFSEYTELAADSSLLNRTDTSSFINNNIIVNQVIDVAFDTQYICSPQFLYGCALKLQIQA